MDRGEGIIRWSPSQARDEFLTLEINYRIIQRYKATGQAVPEQFDYERTSKHTDFQTVTAFDWSPTVGGLVAIGGKGGEVQLLRIDDDSNDSILLPLKLQRTCQAVAFNTTGLLAVGLDRVRNDQCLQIWDVEQCLSKWDPSKKGWQTSPTAFVDPLHKLEPSVSVTSVKFFEDQPQTLVVGIKNQCVRIHDLRDPHVGVVTFQTRCNNNLAVDHADPNYFASSALDQPGVMIWDRRATSRQAASKMYLESIDGGELPFGCALKLNNVINPINGAYIRSLRYCRDRPGLLAVLSSAGELQVLDTEKEFVEALSENDLDESPEMLLVKQSYPLQYPFYDKNFGCSHDDRVVSSDWATLGSPNLQPRVVARRCNQKLEVLLMPMLTQHLAFDLINFSARARHGEYANLPRFTDPEETEHVLGPIASMDAQRNAVFGKNLNAPLPKNPKNQASVPRSSRSDVNIQKFMAPKLEWTPTLALASKSAESVGHNETTEIGAPGSSVNNPAPIRPFSSREQHERSHWAALDGPPFSTVPYAKLNNRMLQRCRKGYLFDCEKNRSILTDDPWLQDIWLWIEGAENLAEDEGMISKGIDLRYVGVCNIWNNDIGHKSQSRLIDTTGTLNSSEWAHVLEDINKRAYRLQFDGTKTNRPHHRLLSLAICGWGKTGLDLHKALEDLEVQGQFTKAAAWALYENVPQRAVEILRRGGKDLLFIGLALNLHLKGAEALDENDWSKVLKERPEMMADPYLRAIYALISTNDWKAVADETALPLRDRVGVAVRHLNDLELTSWLEKQMIEAIETGDIEGIVLTGITDKMVDILAKYIEKFGDYQTASLIMSNAAPLYIDDYRCSQWREDYRDLLNTNKLHIDRCKFDVQSTKKSRQRDGITVIKPPPRQVTLRCVRCDTALTNDLANTANPPTSATSGNVSADRNPLYSIGVHAGISCPKCGRHLGRCAVCLQTLGMPRTDRPGLSTEKQALLANFMTFCLKCDHACHADHSGAWFARHNECPAPDCRCPCNQQDIKINSEYEVKTEVNGLEQIYTTG